MRIITSREQTPLRFERTFSTSLKASMVRTGDWPLRPTGPDARCAAQCSPVARGTALWRITLHSIASVSCPRHRRALSEQTASGPSRAMHRGTQAMSNSVPLVFAGGQMFLSATLFV